MTEADARTALIEDIQEECARTRTMLARVPQASLPWTPHPRSLSLGALASHLADVPHWGAQLLRADHYDLAGATGHRPARSTTGAILAAFDRHVDELLDAVRTVPKSAVNAPWALRRGAIDLAVMPHLTAVRRFMLHHLVHHRGQLTVYLRLLDIPVPPTYGPTADETP